MNIHNIRIEGNRFLQLWRRYEAIHVPDPTQTAINEMLHPVRVALPQQSRVQLENLVAYWRTHAKPGRVALALASRHYVMSLRNWKPTGALQ